MSPTCIVKTIREYGYSGEDDIAVDALPPKPHYVSAESQHRPRIRRFAVAKVEDKVLVPEPASDIVDCREDSSEVHQAYPARYSKRVSSRFDLNGSGHLDSRA